MKRISLLFALFFALSSFGQSNSDGWDKRADKQNNNFYEVQDAFYQFWEGKQRAKGNGYKVFQRWENQMIDRVYPSGDLTLPSSNYEKYVDWLHDNPQEEEQDRSTANWTSLYSGGVPTGYDAGAGKINFISFHPTDANTMWIGAPDGGLWKTTNGGGSWTTNSDFLTVVGCAGLVIDPNTPTTMYLATGDKEHDRRSLGVWKSTDGGTTWNTTGLSWTAADNYRITKMVMDPGNAQHMMVTTDGGIWRTTDGWVNKVNIDGSEVYNDIEFQPGNSNIVYAASNLIYRSTDNGASWSLATGLPASSQVDRIELATTAANGNYVYAIYGGTDYGYLGLYRSTNGGVSYSLRSDSPNILHSNANPGPGDTGGQSFHDLDVVVSPTNANLVTIGGINQWQSTNGGSTWNRITFWLGADPAYPGSNSEPEPYIHADIQCIYYQPGSSSTIFTGSDGGISKSTDNGVTWTDITNNLNIAQQTSISLAATDDNIFFNGLQDIGSIKYTSGAQKVISGGDGEDGFIDRTNPLKIISSTTNGAFFLSTDGGVNYNDVNGLPGNGEWFSPIHQDPVNATKVYVGGYTNLYASTNVLSGGSTWTTLGNPAGTGNILRFAIASSSNNVIYSLKSDAIAKSTNSGVSWTNVTGTLPVGDAMLKNICVSNTDANKVWVVFSGYSDGNKVFHSTNGGTSWTNISTGLPNLPMNTIVYTNGSTSDAVYIGADMGVFYKDNTLGSWTLFNTGLPNNAVSDLEIAYTTGKLRAATYGRGAWETDLFVQGVPGCMNATACNYNSAATIDNGSCVSATGCDTCSGATDGTGTVIDNPEVGDACDDNDAATTNDMITSCGVCQGTIPVVSGCTSATACNYNSAATIDDGSCVSATGCDTCSGATDGTGTVVDNPEVGDACDDNDAATTNDVITACGVCQGTIPGVSGCTTATACNYNSAATVDDGSCVSATGCDTCSGATDGTGTVVDNPEVGDACDDNNAATTNDMITSCGVCQGTIPGVSGCTSATACNYNSAATIDDGSCVSATGCDTCSGATDGTGTVVDNPEVGDACDDNDAATTNDMIISCGVCQGTFPGVSGCTSAIACNYNSAATIDDGSCVSATGCDTCSGATDGTGTVVDNPEIGDACDDNDAATTNDMIISCGVCQGTFPGVSGCTSATACNYNSAATIDDGSCVSATGCDTCSGATDGTGTVVDNPEVGDACDDNDAATTNDMITSCGVCQGVTSCPPPVNNDAAGAAPNTADRLWGVPGWDEFIINTACATLSMQACDGSNPTSDTWYTFVAQAENQGILARANPADANVATVDIAVEVFDATLTPLAGTTSGSCTESRSCFNNVGAGQIERCVPGGLTIGATYFYRVYDTAGASTGATLLVDTKVKTYAPHTIGEGCVPMVSNGAHTWTIENPSNLYNIPPVPVFFVRMVITDLSGTVVSMTTAKNPQTTGGLNFSLAEFAPGLPDGDYVIHAQNQVKMMANGCVSSYWSQAGPGCAFTQGDLTEAGGISNVSTSTDDITFAAYPNPNNGDQVFLELIDFEDVLSDVVVTIFDMYGKQVHMEQFATSTNDSQRVITFDQNLSAGMYSINLTVNDIVITQQLIVQ